MIIFKTLFIRDKSKAYDTNNRVNRGGNYNNDGSKNPASNRNNNKPDNSNDNKRFPCSSNIILDYIF